MPNDAPNNAVEDQGDTKTGGGEREWHGVVIEVVQDEACGWWSKQRCGTTDKCEGT